MTIEGISAIIIAYLLGSIPFSYIFARLVKGIDIRQVGTHNAGAMNTVREIGKLPGAAVLILDIAKGSLSILIAQRLGVSSTFVFLAGLAAVAGHTWPVYLRFRGGRGTATTLGVLLALAPREFAINLAIISVIVLITRDTGTGVGTGLVITPLLLWIFGEDLSLILYSIVIAVFLLMINLSNFRRDVAEASGVKNYLSAKRPPVWRRRKK